MSQGATVSKSYKEINKQMLQIEGQIQATLDAAYKKKIELQSLVAKYEYLNSENCKNKINEAVSREIQQLTKYQKIQKQLIAKLKKKNADGKLEVIKNKLPLISQKIKQYLHEQKLLELLVTLDTQLQKIEKRRDLVQKKLQDKERQFPSSKKSNSRSYQFNMS